MGRAGIIRMRSWFLGYVFGMKVSGYQDLLNIRNHRLHTLDPLYFGAVGHCDGYSGRRTSRFMVHGKKSSSYHTRYDEAQIITR